MHKGHKRPTGKGMEVTVQMIDKEREGQGGRERGWCRDLEDRSERRRGKREGEGGKGLYG